MAESDLNLLEWYAAHRSEGDVLRDPSALFALGLLDHIGETTRGEFQQDLGIDAAQLDQTIEKLYDAGFLSTHGTTLAITPQGKQFLTEIGLRGPLPPPSGSENTPDAPEPPTHLPERPPPKPPTPPPPRTPFWFWALIGILIIGILLVFGVLPNIPGIQPPTPITPTIITRTPTPVTPTVVTRTATSPAPSSSTPTPTTPRPTVVTRTPTPTPPSPSPTIITSTPTETPSPTIVTPTPTETVISLTSEQQTQTVEVTLTPTAKNYVWTIVDKDPPFDNLRLQYAMAHAVDEPAIAKMVLQGAGSLHNSDPKLDELEYDLARAQELSKEAQYDGQPVFIVPNQDRTSVELANLLAKYLADAGFDVRPLTNVPSRATILVEPEP